MLKFPFNRRRVGAAATTVTLTVALAAGVLIVRQSHGKTVELARASAPTSGVPTETLNPSTSGPSTTASATEASTSPVAPAEISSRIASHFATIVNTTNSKPPLSDPPTLVPGPTDSASPAIGLLEVHAGPMSRDTFTVSNLYQDWFGGSLYQIYAGQTAGDSQNGEADGPPGVAVYTEDPNTGSVVDVGIYKADGSQGTLTITGRDGDIVDLVDSAGVTFAFNPTTLRFTS